MQDMHPRGIAMVGCFVFGSIESRDAPAGATPCTPVAVTVVGKGRIRLMVAEPLESPSE